MKKFFKALAVVLALTLVIGTIPASAATKVSPKKSKVIYVGGARGTDNDGNKSVLKRRVTYAKLLGITKAEAKKLKVTAKSSNAKIAKANDTTRRVGAKGIGKATVTLTCEGKKYDVKVVVRKNADKVLFGEDWADVNDTLTFEAAQGQEYTVSLPRYEGKTKLDTDERRIDADESVVVTPVEGKERVYTVKFTKAGDVTVTGVAYQAENLPVATAKAEVKVTVIPADFAAEAIGVKTIKVTGSGFTAETSKDDFTVKRDTVKVTVDKVEFVDETTVNLKLATRITEGKYTVTDKNEKSASFDAQDEYVKEIVIEEDGGEVATKVNADKTVSIIVHYDVLNQYGESVRKSYAVKWTSSYGNDNPDDKASLGYITFTNTASTSAITFGSPIVINAVYTGAGKVATKTANCTAGMENAVGTVDVLGVVDIDTKKTYDSVPANFTDGKYALYFQMKDRLGYAMPYSNADAQNLSFISQDPMIVQFTKNSTKPEANKSITVDGEEYAYIIMTPGYEVKKGGNVELIITSTKTGLRTPYTLKVDSSQVLKSISLAQPEGVVCEGETIEIPYEAFDTEGGKITNFGVLNNSLAMSGTGFYVEEKKDGSAVMYYKASGTGATKEVPATVVLLASPKNGGNSAQLTLSVKAPAMNYAIKDLTTRNDRVIFEGGSQTILFKDQGYGDDGMIWYDQYDREVPSWKQYLFGTGYWVKAEKLGNDFVSITNVIDAGDHIGFKITANSNVTGTKDEQVVRFVLMDGSNKEVGGSEKKVTFTIADISQGSTFAINFNHGKVQNGTGTTTGTVTATLADGTKAPVPNQYIKYQYAEVEINSASRAAINIGPGADALWTAYTFPANNGSANNAFKDYTKRKSDGDYQDRLPEVKLVANIADDWSATTPAAIGKAEKKFGIGNYAKHTVKFGVHNDDVVQNVADGKATIQARNGVISAADLVKIIDNYTDNYDDTTYGPNAAWKAANVSISISDYVETINGLHSDHDKTAANGGAIEINNNMSKTASIVRAEIGDTFKATFSYDWASITIEFTVAADTSAWFGSKTSSNSKNESAWY